MTTVIAARSGVLDRVNTDGLIAAFTASKQAGYERLRYPGAPAVGLPWLQDHLAEVDALFDGDPFPYGIAGNQPLLNAFIENLSALDDNNAAVTAEALFPSSGS